MTHTFRRGLRNVCLMAVSGLSALAADFDNPKAHIPPQAHQNRMSGGESMPPLPLPATPIRRTERKREPAPPPLVGKINLSLLGNTGSYPSITLDIENLMNWTNSQLKLRYRYVETDLLKFSFNPTELPVLYLTGWTPLPELSNDLLEKLRSYLQAGGTLMVHANCGRPEFRDSFRMLQARLYPDRPMGPIPLDHPIYSCLNKIQAMKVREGTGAWKQVPVYLEAMNLGCRAAIIFSPIDISWGWDAKARPIEGGILYDQGDSLRLGANLLTYILANYEYGRAFEIQKIYHQLDMKTRDQLVIAQLQHPGDWDPTPHGLPNLLKFIDANSTMTVQFKRTALNLESPDLLKQPIIYMTGLRSFGWTSQQQQRLRSYLEAGGVLIAESAMGSAAFDESFRQQMAQVMPKARLTPLNPDHAVFHNVFKLDRVRYSPLVETAEPNLQTPLLEVMLREGSPCVIYSRLALSNGWEQLPNPYSRSYADQSSLELGTNILVYALTH